MKKLFFVVLLAGLVAGWTPLPLHAEEMVPNDTGRHILLVGNPDRGMYLWQFVSVPAEKLKDRLVLPDGTVVGYRRPDDLHAVRRQAAALDALIKAGHGIPITDDLALLRDQLGAVEMNRQPFQEKELGDCVPTEKCLTAYCFPACIPGAVVVCVGQCSDCTEITICG